LTEFEKGGSAREGGLYRLKADRRRTGMMLYEKMLVRVVVVAEAGEEEVEVRDPFDSSQSETGNQ